MSRVARFPFSMSAAAKHPIMGSAWRMGLIGGGIACMALFGTIWGAVGSAYADSGEAARISSAVARQLGLQLGPEGRGVDPQPLPPVGTPSSSRRDPLAGGPDAQKDIRLQFHWVTGTSMEAAREAIRQAFPDTDIEAEQPTGGRGGRTLGEGATMRVRLGPTATTASQLEALPGLAWVDLPVPVKAMESFPFPAPLATRVEAITSEGVAISGTDRWHRAGLRGEGMVVGIIDVDDMASAKDGPHADELPVFAAQWYPRGFRGSGGAHARAVAEVLYDFAPEARFLYAGVGFDADVLEALDWMKAQGASVVNASIGFANEFPADGQSALARKVDELRAEGIVVVCAAGNEGRSYVRATLRDDDSDGYVDFPDPATGATVNHIALGYRPPGNVTLRWDSDWWAPREDLDLELWTADALVATANDRQGPDSPAPPKEQLLCGETPDEACGAPPGPWWLKVRYDPQLGSPLGRRIWLYAQGEWPQGVATSGGHNLSVPADAAGAIAVGAVAWKNRRVPTYVSLGPTDDGRAKPDVWGITHVSTASWGIWQSEDINPGFTGTSAATPYVAGIAALLWGLRPDFSAERLVAELALSIDPDFIVDAPQAAAALVRMPPIGECGCSDCSAGAGGLGRRGTRRGAGGGGLGGGAIPAVFLALIGLQLARTTRGRPRPSPLPRA